MSTIDENGGRGQSFKQNKSHELNSEVHLHRTNLITFLRGV